VLGLAAVRGGLDAHHASAAAGALTRQDAGLVERCGLGRIGLFGAGRHGEPLARLRDVGGSIAVGGQQVRSKAWARLMMFSDTGVQSNLAGEEAPHAGLEIRRGGLSAEIETSASPATVYPMVVHNQANPWPGYFRRGEIDILPDKPSCVLNLRINKPSARAAVSVEDEINPISD
jgi:hypothetical protein